MVASTITRTASNNGFTVVIRSNQSVMADNKNVMLTLYVI
jgi:hypothetical protein